MVFRKDNKVDAFQRQISALRQQLGAEEGDLDARDDVQAQGDSEPDPAFSTTRGAAYGRRVEPGRTPARFDSGGGSAYGIDLSDATSFVPTPPTTDVQTSVVAHDTAWKGDLRSSGSLHVHGRVDGSIEATDDVYVAEEAEVDATIVATNVVVAGSVRGTVRCTARFEALPQGRVQGEVFAPTLVVHEGATLNATFAMRTGDAGAEAARGTEDRPSLVRRRAAQAGG